MVSPVPTRLLLIALTLLGGDYLLWSWATNGNSDTLALISGIALVPLILVVLWLFALGVARTVIARPMRGATEGRVRRISRGRLPGLGSVEQRTPATATSMKSRSDRSSEKIAA